LSAESIGAARLTNDVCVVMLAEQVPPPSSPPDAPLDEVVLPEEPDDETPDEDTPDDPLPLDSPEDPVPLDPLYPELPPPFDELPLEPLDEEVPSSPEGFGVAVPVAQLRRALPQPKASAANRNVHFVCWPIVTWRLCTAVRPLAVINSAQNGALGSHCAHPRAPCVTSRPRLPLDPLRYHGPLCSAR
jgi:hypothetical protein